MIVSLILFRSCIKAEKAPRRSCPRARTYHARTPSQPPAQGQSERKSRSLCVLESRHGRPMTRLLCHPLFEQIRKEIGILQLGMRNKCGNYCKLLTTDDSKSSTEPLTKYLRAHARLADRCRIGRPCNNERTLITLLVLLFVFLPLRSCPGYPEPSTERTQAMREQPSWL